MSNPLVLERGPLRVTVGLDPLAIEIRRGRRLIRELRLWAAGGESRDQFVQLTEGVLAAEELEQPVLFGRAERSGDSFRGELGQVRVELEDERVLIEFEPVARTFRIGEPSGRRAPASASAGSAPATASRSSRPAGTYASAPIAATPVPTAPQTCSTWVAFRRATTRPSRG